MSDSLPSIDEILQSSRLNQRLVQRYTRPLGVINTQRLQSRFLQLPRAIAQRLAFITQLQTRYSNYANDAELPLAKAQSTTKYQTNLSLNLPPAPATSTLSESSAVASGFRVSRQVIPVMNASVSDQSTVNEQSALAKSFSQSVAPEKIAVTKPANPTTLIHEVSVLSLQSSSSTQETQTTIVKSLPLINQTTQVNSHHPNQINHSQKIELPHNHIASVTEISPQLTIVNQPQLIFRQADSTPPSQHSQNNAPNGLKVAPIPPQLATQRLNPMMVSHIPETSTQPDHIEDIAEQVSRILSRQLRIERERRGIGR